jgi:hypothetical protein
MTTAVATVLASCQRLLLGRPSFAQASDPAEAVQSQWEFEPGSCGAGLAGAAFRRAHHAQRTRDGSRHAPQWG